MAAVQMNQIENDLFLTMSRECFVLLESKSRTGFRIQKRQDRSCSSICSARAKSNECPS